MKTSPRIGIMPPRKNTHCRVVAAIDTREVVLYLLDSNGEMLEEERFGLVPNAPNIDPQFVARDVWNLLYQCAIDALNRDEA